MPNNIFNYLKPYIDNAHQQAELKNSCSYNEEFSFFLAIAEHYRRENFHSDIIKLILDPLTTQIGNNIILKSFLEYIGIPQKDFGKLDKNVKITREEKKIDILIRHEITKNAIIIENKINDAVDQTNQLARYYESLTANDYTVLKIVYTTKFGGIKPNYSQWDPKYQKIAETIFNQDNKLFFDLPAQSQNKCWIKFLTICIHLLKGKEDEKSILTRIFLEQYKILLEKIVETQSVTTKDISNIAEIFSGTYKNKIQEFVELWEKRGECAYEYIKQKIESKNNNDLKTSIVYGSECIVSGDSKNGAYIYPYFDSIQIGFYRETEWSEKVKKDKHKILTETCNNILNFKIEEKSIYQIKNWYCVNIPIDQYKDFNEINKLFTKALKSL